MAAKAIEVSTYGAALDVCDRPVVTSDYEAKFSLQHCVAAALQRGKMDFAAFGDEARAEAAPLAQKVRVTTGEPYAAAYPVSWGAGISVELEDGTRIDSRKDECKGDPEAALSDDEMISKARDLMRFGGVNDSARVIDGIMNLSNGGDLPDLGAYFASAA